MSELFTCVFDRGGNRSPLFALSTDTDVDGLLPVTEASGALPVPLGSAAAASMLTITTTKPATTMSLFKYTRRIDLLRSTKVAFATCGP